MSNKGHDIDDDEIRIISSRPQPVKPEKTSSGRRLRAAGLFVIIAAVVLFFVLKGCGGTAAEDDAEYPLVTENPDPVVSDSEVTDSLATVVKDNEVGAATVSKAPAVQEGYITMRDTAIAGARLTVYTPVDAVPELAIGFDVLADSTVLMAFQAADIRADNGQIVSAFVDHGQLISTGQSKAGFCAIIDGKITLGVADVTQYFEQALTSGGYFFRQYPLVVGNQVIENKPKGRSLRKALAELNGKVVVIASRNELTFGEFSRAMVDMGVSTAIYLVGSKSYGIVRLPDGEALEYNLRGVRKYPENTNFIVWK